MAKSKTMFDEEYDKMLEATYPCAYCSETCDRYEDDDEEICTNCYFDREDKNRGEKMEKQIKIEKEISNLATALCKAQGVMGGAKKTSNNPFFKSKYSDLASVFDTLREPFSSNGLSIVQLMDVLDSGVTVLVTRLMHVSGESIDSKMILPIDANPQKFGSIITYFKRYALMAICGIASEDDDGNLAANKIAPKPINISLEQISTLETLINGYDDIREKLLNACQQELSNITEDRYQNALAWIKKLILEKSIDKMEKVKKVDDE